MPQGQHRVILLIGFMGAGKTTVGRALAQRLHWRFLDLDEVVVAREGRPIADIFRDSGEEGFRARESEALQELLRELALASDNTVLALGGGAILQQQSQDAIRRSGFPVFFLDAAPQELFARCQPQGIERPLLRSFDDFERLYRSREPHYRALGARVVTSGTSVQEISQHIQRTLGFAEETN